MSKLFQHTAARRRLVSARERGRNKPAVSTHSRPKAAGDRIPVRVKILKSFNTQPPEGGWLTCHVEIR